MLNSPVPQFPKIVQVLFEFKQQGCISVYPEHGRIYAEIVFAGFRFAWREQALFDIWRHLTIVAEVKENIYPRP